jgi:hypothetical protein
LKTFQGAREIWKCGNGVEQTGDAEGVIHTAWRADETQAAAFAGESGALTDESADAGTIHLNKAAEIDEQFFATGRGDSLKFAIEEFAIFAEGGAAARLDNDDVAIGASVDFEFWMFNVHDGHFTFSQPKALYDGEAIAPSRSFRTRLLIEAGGSRTRPYA